MEGGNSSIFATRMDEKIGVSYCIKVSKNCALKMLLILSEGDKTQSMA